LEFQFGDDLNVSYTFLDKQENIELQHEKEVYGQELRDFHLMQMTGNFMIPEVWNKLKNWKDK
jgi:hypothetical protein